MMDLPQNLDDGLAYSEYIAGSAKAIRDSLKSKVTDAQIQSDIGAMVEFEVELAKVTFFYATKLLSHRRFGSTR